MACILRFFRIWRHSFLTFPYGTASINHQKFGALSCAALLSLKIEPACDISQAGFPLHNFFDFTITTGLKSRALPAE